MTLFIVAAAYLGIGTALMAKWQQEELQYAPQDRAGPIGCIIAAFIWPVIILVRSFS